MLDLGKPYGEYEGLVFYGDHEDDSLVYYLPDEVGLAPRNGQKRVYELFFQFFQESKMVSGTARDLEASAGSFLQLGVCCTVKPDRLKKALKKLKAAHELPDNLSATTPMWSDGTVKLITFDAESTDDFSANKKGERFVEQIKGSQKPSLASGDLKSIFSVELDRRGTELVHSALLGGSGAVAGVIYDLKFTGIRPAAAIKIKADLSKCQETAAHHLGLDASYVSQKIDASLNAEFDWLTQKMVENSDIQIEVLSTAETDTEKQLFNKLVSEFKDKVLEELFNRELAIQQSNSPLAESLGKLANTGADALAQNANKEAKGADDAAQSASPPKIGIKYSFKHEKIELGRTIEVDYSERSAVTRTHSPQSQLWMLGLGIKENFDNYVDKVDLGQLRLNHEANIRLLYDFTSQTADLLSAEVLLWRKKDGIAPVTGEGRFSMPSNAEPIDCFIFDKDHAESHQLAWLRDDSQDVGYYYQLRLIYDNKIKNISTPHEIVTTPVVSYSRDLAIIPDSQVFYKNIPISSRSINYEVFSSIDLIFVLYDAQHNIMDTQIVSLDKDNKEDWLVVRGKDQSGMHIEMSKVFHFVSGRAAITTSPIYLVDDEVIVSNPLVTRDLVVLLSGKAANIENIILNLEAVSGLSDDAIVSTILIEPGAKSVEKAHVELFSKEDIVRYTAQAVYLLPDGSRDIRDIQSGELTSSGLMQIALNLSNASSSTLKINWKYSSLDNADMKSICLIIKDGEGNELKTLKYSGSAELKPVTFDFETGTEIYMDIEKRFLSGGKEVQKNVKIDSLEISI